MNIHHFNKDGQGVWSQEGSSYFWSTNFYLETNWLDTTNDERWEMVKNVDKLGLSCAKLISA